MRAGVRRDWIIAANMEYQPLRKGRSGHGLARDCPRSRHVTHRPRVNWSVIQGRSETSDAKGCQERIDQSWRTCVDLFCPPYPNRSNQSVDRCGHRCRIVWQCALSSTGRDIICGKMPCSKFGRLARYTIAPHGGAFQPGEPLKVVAIGSSSTVGPWVLRSAATYPEVVRRVLSRLRSNTATDRSQQLTGIRADAVRTCAHVPLCQPAY